MGPEKFIQKQYLKKTGPEAGQYFHVRPPIGFIGMGYKTQEE